MASVAAIVNLPRDMDRQYLRKEDAFLNYTKAVSHPRVSVCAFWSPLSTSWRTSGCVRVASTLMSTTCSCTHLTHFAILAAPVYTELDVSHEFSLSVITWLGLLLSCLCLLLSVATFCACRSLQSDRTTLHKNLALCLLVANVVFLAGVGQTAHKAVCALVAALLHFAFLAAFLWMLLEGVQLYVMLVQVNVGFLTLTLYKMIRHSSHVKPVSGNTGSLR
ncbi:unnamed protein product, partial [Lampetra fluviatilis]